MWNRERSVAITSTRVPFTPTFVGRQLKDAIQTGLLVLGGHYFSAGKFSSFEDTTKVEAKSVP